jgi:hypothetical protein
VTHLLRRGPLAAFLLILALSLPLVAVACGDDDDDDARGDSTPAMTDGARLGKLTISGQWVRPTTNDVSAAYLTVHNSGAADTLIKAATPLTSTVQLHEVITEGSSSKMQEKPGGFPVPANGTLELKPGGFHIMLMGLKAPIAVGETVSLTLTFEKAGEITIDAPVKAAPDMSGMDHGSMSSSTTPAATATTAMSGMPKDVTLGSLTITGQWVRTTTNNVTAAYLVVKNTGVADRLIKASTPLTATVQLHEVITEGSTSKMQEKAGGFPIPANGMLELKPGGFHIMLMDLKAPVTEGQVVPITLTFEKAGEVTIMAAAKPGSDSGMNMGTGMATATPMR